MRLPAPKVNDGGRMMICANCGVDIPTKFHYYRLCGVCQISSSGAMPLVGMEYRTRGRVDRINPYKDTMRALEYIANHEPKHSKADIQRWKKQAEYLPDKSTKLDYKDWDHGDIHTTTPAVQANERDQQGRMREFWNQCKYDYRDQKGKAETDTQKRNFDVVKSSGEA